MMKEAIMHSQPRPIYLDNNATTSLAPEVLQAMMPWLTHAYGNAASNSHVFGWEASKAVEQARALIATAINAASPTDIIFTSGATESINLALAGLQPLEGNGKGHIITSMIEHKAVLDSCARLASEGTSVTYLPPTHDGIICPDVLSRAIRPDTRLVSIMAANNETGTLQQIAEIGAICREKGVLFHTDATQAFGKIPFDVRRMNISLASFSAHKIYGPMGIGTLYVNTIDPRLTLSPIIVGGGHGGLPIQTTFLWVACMGIIAALLLGIFSFREPRAQSEALLRPWMRSITTLAKRSVIRPIVMVGLGGAVFPA